MKTQTSKDKPLYMDLYPQPLRVVDKTDSRLFLSLDLHRIKREGQRTGQIIG